MKVKELFLAKTFNLFNTILNVFVSHVLIIVDKKNNKMHKKGLRIQLYNEVF